MNRQDIQNTLAELEDFVARSQTPVYGTRGYPGGNRNGSMLNQTGPFAPPNYFGATQSSISRGYSLGAELRNSFGEAGADVADMLPLAGLIPFGIGQQFNSFMRSALPQLAWNDSVTAQLMGKANSVHPAAMLLGQGRMQNMRTATELAAKLSTAMPGDTLMDDAARLTAARTYIGKYGANEMLTSAGKSLWDVAVEKYRTGDNGAVTFDEILVEQQTKITQAVQTAYIKPLLNFASGASAAYTRDTFGEEQVSAKFDKAKNMEDIRSYITSYEHATGREAGDLVSTDVTQLAAARKLMMADVSKLAALDVPTLRDTIGRNLHRSVADIGTITSEMVKQFLPPGAKEMLKTYALPQLASDITRYTASQGVMYGMSGEKLETALGLILNTDFRNSVKKGSPSDTVGTAFNAMATLSGYGMQFSALNNAFGKVNMGVITSAEAADGYTTNLSNAVQAEAVSSVRLKNMTSMLTGVVGSATQIFSDLFSQDASNASYAAKKGYAALISSTSNVGIAEDRVSSLLASRAMTDMGRGAFLDFSGVLISQLSEQANIGADKAAAFVAGAISDAGAYRSANKNMSDTDYVRMVTEKVNASVTYDSSVAGSYASKFGGFLAANLAAKGSELADANRAVAGMRLSVDENDPNSMMSIMLKAGVDRTSARALYNAYASGDSNAIPALMNKIAPNLANFESKNVGEFVPDVATAAEANNYVGNIGIKLGVKQMAKLAELDTHEQRTDTLIAYATKQGVALSRADASNYLNSKAHIEHAHILGGTGDTAMADAVAVMRRDVDESWHSGKGFSARFATMMSKTADGTPLDWNAIIGASGIVVIDEDKAITQDYIHANNAYNADKSPANFKKLQAASTAMIEVGKAITESISLVDEEGGALDSVIGTEASDVPVVVETSAAGAGAEEVVKRLEKQVASKAAGGAEKDGDKAGAGKMTIGTATIQHLELTLPMVGSLPAVLHLKSPSEGK